MTAVYLRKTLGHLNRVLKHSLQGHYRPPEYEDRWGRPTHSPLYPLLSGYRKARDRRFVRRHLRDSDVFLVGHPKSGNTWVAYMLAIIINRDFDSTINLADLKQYAPTTHGEDHRISRYSTLEDPRIFRNEWPVHPELYPRVIYLVRDPRSALVSYYHMYRTITGDEALTMDAFVREYLARGCVVRLEPNIRWDVQLQYWAERAKRNHNTIVVRYEDMVQRREDSLKRMLRFAEIPHTPELIRLVLERGGFESMKKTEETHGAESYLHVKGCKGAFIRRGKIDSWRDEMEPETVRLIEQELGPAMISVGYELTDGKD